MKILSYIFWGAFVTICQGNVIDNSSFEISGDNADKAKNWSSGSQHYCYYKRTNKQAASGKYSIMFHGNGKDIITSCQSVEKSKLSDVKSLNISCKLYIHSFKQGIIKPIHVTVTVKEGQKVKTYFHGKAFRLSNTLSPKKWHQITYCLNLEKYSGNLVSIAFWSLAWINGKNYFEGQFFIDDYVVESIPEKAVNKSKPKGKRDEKKGTR